MTSNSSFNRVTMLFLSVVLTSCAMDPAEGFEGDPAVTFELPDPTITFEEVDVDDGAYVEDLVSGGPGQRAGLRQHDVIVEIDHEPIEAVDEVVEIVRRHKVGETVSVVVQRGRSTEVVKVEIGNMGPQPKRSAEQE